MFFFEKDISKIDWIQSTAIHVFVIMTRGMVSVLVLLPARELTDLGTEPYQEFLTLILKPRIAFLYGIRFIGIRVMNSGPTLMIIFWFGLGLG